MFDQFLNQGNLVAVILMTYSGSVMIEALLRERRDPSGWHTPPIIKHWLSSVFIFCSIPCAFWPAIYIGMFDGLVSGIVAWIGLQIAGGIGTIAMGVRGPSLGFHFIAACIAYPIGYYLSLSNLAT